MLMAASPPALLVQPPRVAMLFELRDSVVRDGVTLVLGQSFFQTAHDLSGASKREATSVKACYGQTQEELWMCGRFTVKATWAELMALYRLTMDAPPHNLRPRYNVCPTDPVDVVTAEEGKRELVPMRWGLIPRW
jgi:hypothetical protein